jgi:succinate dehydrogenase / fumarate reductase, cytochrome b subunit
VAFHVRHGLWSAFQTVGANHPKYMPFIQKLSVVFAVIVGLGFGSLPLVILVMS